MGLFDFFNQGETGGIPDGTPQNLLQNPLLQVGLGLLANNTSRSFGQNLGRGGLQALQSMQQGRILNETAQFRKAQADELKRRQEEQEQQIAQQKAQEQAQMDAVNRVSSLPAGQVPSFNDLYMLDPKSALKMKFPEATNDTAQSSYFQAISTPQGLAKFNARTGELELITNQQGKPYTKSTDDPMLQEQIALGKARAGASYKPNTDIEGKVFTTRQVSEMADPRIVPRSVQSKRDDLRMQILLDEQRNAGGAGVNPELDAEIARMGGGISVPTKAELKAQEIMAKDKAESIIDLPRVIEEGQNTIQLVDDLVNSKGFETAVGLSSKLDPRNYLAGTDAKDFNIRLDQLKGKQFLQAFQSLKGGGQITEVEGKKATDAISRMNTSASEEEFKRAANEFKSVIQKGLERAKNKSGVIMPQNERMPQSTMSSGGWSAKKVK